MLKLALEVIDVSLPSKGVSKEPRRIEKTVISENDLKSILNDVITLHKQGYVLVLQL